MRWRLKAVQAQQVSALFARYARRTRQGVPVRCNRGQSPSGPIIFPSPVAARAAVEELAAALGRPHRAVPCTRGRHWHVQPVDGQEDPGDDLESAS